MKNEIFSVALIGMLQYYGVIPLTELLVICNRCELCQLHDYKKLQYKIRDEEILSQKVFLYKKLVCQKEAENPLHIRDLQKKTIAAEYKMFSLQEYLSAGKANWVCNENMQQVKNFLCENCTTEEKRINVALGAVWLGLQDTTDLALLTAQCAKSLGLPSGPNALIYMQLLEKIQLLSNSMPRWVCKGYSYQEIDCIELERERKALLC